MANKKVESIIEDGLDDLDFSIDESDIEEISLEKGKLLSNVVYEDIIKRLPFLIHP